MGCLLDLPPEIIDLTVDYLDTSALLQCCVVSQAWERLFLFHLYRTIDIRDNQHLAEICHSFLASAQRQRNVVDAVRDIRVNVKSITDRHLPLLPAWCKNVDTLHLEWSIWNDQSQPPHRPPQPVPDPPSLFYQTTANISETAFNYLASFLPGQEEQPDDPVSENDPPPPPPAKIDFTFTLASFLAPFAHLKHLSTKLSFGSQEDDLPAFLPFLPSLTHLVMYNGHYLDADYLDFIHTQCPQLHSLTLQCSMIHNIPELLASQATYQTSQARPLRALSVKFMNGLPGYFNDWLLYFALNYPHLADLKLRQYGTTTSARFLDFIQSSPAATQHMDATDIIAKFGSHCTALTTLELRNISLPAFFFTALSRPLRNVCLELPTTTSSSNTSQHTIGVPFAEKLLNSPLLFHHLTTLDLAPAMEISFPPVSPPLFDTDQLIRLLSQYRHLTDLALRWKAFATPFAFDDLLYALPRLRRLALADARLALSTTFIWQEQRQPDGSVGVVGTHIPPSSSLGLYRPRKPDGFPLVTLELRSVVYSLDVMDWLDTHLPSLSRLCLSNACRSLSAFYVDSVGKPTDPQPSSCHLRLPHLQLDSLEIQDRDTTLVRLYSLLKVPCDLVDIDTPSFSQLQHPQCAWHMVKSCEPGSDGECELVAFDPAQPFTSVLSLEQVTTTCPWYASFCQSAEEVYRHDQLDNNSLLLIRDLPLMHIICRSIRSLVINNKKIPFV
ncbi:hypothetical protein DM01DRAFT_1384265 [Hesseltinella vesiculosa]|uniref:F-box domain-containing protein n=1 Tax=Hesseltinella vesiculosa TaxID=101127 RepID=A0A1X2GEN7_9FUNG|nr:hypothetical protein DM01DRAFT_1384265 [Hesseltinella vesiculosa]